MPVILHVGPYRFFFYSNESNEPPHIHVRAAGNEAKFWLVPIKLAFNHGFSNPELNSVAKLIQEYHPTFLQAWNDYFA